MARLKTKPKVLFFCPLSPTPRNGDRTWSQKLLRHDFPLATSAQRVLGCRLIPTGEELGGGLASSLALGVVVRVLSRGLGISMI